MKSNTWEAFGIVALQPVSWIQFDGYVVLDSNRLPHPVAFINRGDRPGGELAVAIVQGKLSPESEGVMDLRGKRDQLIPDFLFDRLLMAVDRNVADPYELQVTTSLYKRADSGRISFISFADPKISKQISDAQNPANGGKSK